MKRLFWPLVSILLALGVWFFARQRIDSLKAEVDSLRPYKEKHDSLNAHYAEKQGQRAKEEKARLAAMSPQERLDHEMKMATINSYLRDKLGDDVFDELTS
jgi:hypothetical protein